MKIQTKQNKTLAICTKTNSNKWKNSDKITSERGNVTTDTTEKQRLIRYYYWQLYVNIFGINNLGEMKKLLEKHILPNITQKEINNPNCPVPSFNWSCR